jgi:hypothetical protein
MSRASAGLEKPRKQGKNQEQRETHTKGQDVLK